MNSIYRPLTALLLSFCLGLLPSLDALEPAPPDLLATYAAAIGGEERLDKIESLEYRGTIIMAPGMDPAPLTVRIERPNRYWMKIQLPAGQTLSLFDGDKAWYRTILPDDPGTWEPMEAGEAAELKNRAFESARLDHRPDQEGRQTTVEDDTITITYAEGKPRVRTYQDGLLVKEKSADGVSVYSDYQEFGGIQFPTRIVTEAPLGEVVTVFDTILVNPEFPEGTFQANL